MLSKPTMRSGAQAPGLIRPNEFVQKQSKPESKSEAKVEAALAPQMKAKMTRQYVSAKLRKLHEIMEYNNDDAFEASVEFAKNSLQENENFPTYLLNEVFDDIDVYVKEFRELTAWAKKYEETQMPYYFRKMREEHVKFMFSGKQRMMNAKDKLQSFKSANPSEFEGNLSSILETVDMDFGLSKKDVLNLEAIRDEATMTSKAAELVGSTESIMSELRLPAQLTISDLTYEEKRRIEADTIAMVIVKSAAARIPNDPKREMRETIKSLAPSWQKERRMEIRQELRRRKGRGLFSSAKPEGDKSKDLGNEDDDEEFFDVEEIPENQTPLMNTFMVMEEKKKDMVTSQKYDMNTLATVLLNKKVNYYEKIEEIETEQDLMAAKSKESMNHFFHLKGLIDFYSKNWDFPETLENGESPNETYKEILTEVAGLLFTDYLPSRPDWYPNTNGNNEENVRPDIVDYLKKNSRLRTEMLGNPINEALSKLRVEDIVPEDFEDVDGERFFMSEAGGRDDKSEKDNNRLSRAGFLIAMTVAACGMHIFTQYLDSKVGMHGSAMAATILGSGFSTYNRLKEQAATIDVSFSKLNETVDSLTQGVSNFLKTQESQDIETQKELNDIIQDLKQEFRGPYEYTVQQTMAIKLLQYVAESVNQGQEEKDRNGYTTDVCTNDSPSVSSMKSAILDMHKEGTLNYQSVVDMVNKWHCKLPSLFEELSMETKHLPEQFKDLMMEPGNYVDEVGPGVQASNLNFPQNATTTANSLTDYRSAGNQQFERLRQISATSARLGNFGTNVETLKREYDNFLKKSSDIISMQNRKVLDTLINAASHTQNENDLESFTNILNTNVKNMQRGHAVIGSVRNRFASTALQFEAFPTTEVTYPEYYYESEGKNIFDVLKIMKQNNVSAPHALSMANVGDVPGHHAEALNYLNDLTKLEDDDLISFNVPTEKMNQKTIQELARITKASQSRPLEKTERPYRFQDSAEESQIVNVFYYLYKMVSWFLYFKHILSLVSLASLSVTQIFDFASRFWRNQNIPDPEDLMEEDEVGYLRHGEIGPATIYALKLSRKRAKREADIIGALQEKRQQILSAIRPENETLTDYLTYVIAMVGAASEDLGNQFFGTIKRIFGEEEEEDETQSYWGDRRTWLSAGMIGVFVISSPWLTGYSTAELLSFASNALQATLIATGYAEQLRESLGTIGTTGAILGVGGTALELIRENSFIRRVFHQALKSPWVSSTLFITSSVVISLYENAHLPLFDVAVMTVVNVSWMPFVNFVTTAVMAGYIKVLSVSTRPLNDINALTYQPLRKYLTNQYELAKSKKERPDRFDKYRKIFWVMATLDNNPESEEKIFKRARLIDENIKRNTLNILNEKYNEFTGSADQRFIKIIQAEFDVQWVGIDVNTFQEELESGYREEQEYRYSRWTSTIAIGLTTLTWFSYLFRGNILAGIFSSLGYGDDKNHQAMELFPGLEEQSSVSSDVTNNLLSTIYDVQYRLNNTSNLSGFNEHTSIIRNATQQLENSIFQSE